MLDKIKEDEIKELLSRLCNNDILEESLSNDNRLVFDQYSLYVNMANEISNRRDNTSKFYISLISIIITITTVFIQYLAPYYILLLIPISLIVVMSKTWEQHIHEYKLLNSAKFKVINDLEKYLPVNGYTTEYKILKKNDYNGLTRWDKAIPQCIFRVSVISLIALLIILVIKEIYNFF